MQNLLTIEQRRALYDDRIKVLMKIGHINKEDMENLIEQLNNVLKDVKDIEDASQKTDNRRYYVFKFLADKGMRNSKMLTANVPLSNTVSIYFISL